MTAPVVALTGVGRTYPGPPPTLALQPCDLTVHRGEYVTVVGSSGAGKSTLLNLIGLLDEPTTGKYDLDGIDVGGLSEPMRAALRGRRIGFVFQEFHLLSHRTATENVALALLYVETPRRERYDRAVEALRRVGLEHRLDALPNTLSGGERQRVAIARALIGHPSLLLCDEPTGNLDTATAVAILDTLEALNADGMTLMVVTHDPAVARRGRRTVTVRDGLLE